MCGKALWFVRPGLLEMLSERLLEDSAAISDRSSLTNDPAQSRRASGVVGPTAAYGFCHSYKLPRQLTAIAMPSTTAAVFFPRSEAVLAIYRPIASRLKRNCGLLSAPGTRNRGALRFAPGVSAPSGLFVLFCLATCLAALRSRIAAFPIKCLIFAGKGEFLSAVAAGQLQILCHNFLSSTL